MKILHTTEVDLRLYRVATRASSQATQRNVSFSYNRNDFTEQGIISMFINLTSLKYPMLLSRTICCNRCLSYYLNVS